MTSRKNIKIFDFNGVNLPSTGMWRGEVFAISDCYYLAPGGGCEVLFSPGLSVCLCVCVSVCPANILVFYFSAIRRDIDLKFMQDTYMVVLNSLK